MIIVKLLDFGLVKATDNRRQTQLTADRHDHRHAAVFAAGVHSGSRSGRRAQRLYSLGGVGYFLFTGHAAFEAASVLEIIRRQVEEMPAAPSSKSPRPIASELEQAIMACLAKSPTARRALPRTWLRSC